MTDLSGAVRKAATQGKRFGAAIQEMGRCAQGARSHSVRIHALCQSGS